VGAEQQLDPIHFPDPYPPVSTCIHLTKVCAERLWFDFVVAKWIQKSSIQLGVSSRRVCD
jgi:hypothetical protein